MATTINVDNFTNALTCSTRTARSEVIGCQSGLTSVELQCNTVVSSVVEDASIVLNARTLHRIPEMLEASYGAFEDNR